MGDLFSKIKTTPSFSELIKNIGEKKCISVSFVNSYSYCLLRNTKMLKKIDNIYCDGILLSIFASLFAFKKIPRVSFDMTSMAPVLFKYIEEKNLSVFFVGSTDEAIKAFCENVKKVFPGMRIAGFMNGYFQKELQEKIITIINDKKADIVICGMGSVKQEEFIVNMMSINTNIKACFTCGGFIHQGAKNLYYYPKIIDALQLRWLYRLLFEPHTRRRFLKYYPRFILYFIFDNLVPVHKY